MAGRLGPIGHGADEGRPATPSASNFTTVPVVGSDFGEVDDFDSDESSRSSGADSPAPVPPHERVWRHPSEIGFAAVLSIDEEPIDIGRTGRSLIGIASVAGLTLAIALAVALQPGSLRSNPDDVVSLTNSRLRIASFDYPERSPGPSAPGNSVANAPAASVPAESALSETGVRLAQALGSIDFAVDSMSTPGRLQQTATTRTPMATARAMGVLSESGEHLLTTMAAVDGIESIDVRLPNGHMVRSRILHTLPEFHIAVLSVTDEPTTGARADIKASGLSTEGADYSMGQPVIVLVESPLELVIGEDLDGVLVSLETVASNDIDTSSVAEGAPLVSKTGHLIGLCTHAGGRLGFVPVGLLESALSKMIRDVGVSPTSLP